MKNKHIYEEQELLSRIAQGEEEAFRLLYQEYYRPLLFFAKSLIDNMAQSEDIVMNVFLKCWERRTHFTEIRDIKSYLYTVVRHACYRYNSQLEVKERHVQSVEKAPVTDDDYISSRIMIAEMIRHIREEIEQLNPKYREVVRLLFVEELPVKEVASRLAITEENVRKRKERAIELLRTRIVRDHLGHLTLFYVVIQSRMN